MKHKYRRNINVYNTADTIKSIDPLRLKTEIIPREKWVARVRVRGIDYPYSDLLDNELLSCNAVLVDCIQTHELSPYNVADGRLDGAICNRMHSNAVIILYALARRKAVKCIVDKTILVLCKKETSKHRHAKNSKPQ